MDKNILFFLPSPLWQTHFLSMIEMIMKHKNKILNQLWNKEKSNKWLMAIIKCKEGKNSDITNRNIHIMENF